MKKVFYPHQIESLVSPTTFKVVLRWLLFDDHHICTQVQYMIYFHSGQSPNDSPPYVGETVHTFSKS